MMHQEPQDMDVISFADYAGIVKRWWPLLLLVPLLAAGSAYWFRSQQAQTVTATTRLLVTPPNSTANEIQAARSQAETYSNLITSQFVLDRVIQKLQLNQSVPSLRQQIGARVEQNTAIIVINAQATDGQQAANIANATAEAAIAWFSELQNADASQNAETIQRSIADLQAQLERTIVDLAALRAKPSPTPEDTQQVTVLQLRQTQLQNQLETWQRVQQTQTLGGQSQLRISDPALPPSPAGQLSAIRDAVLAGIAALALTALLVVLRERLSQRIHGSRDVYRSTGLPLLGAVPTLRRKPRLDIVQAPQGAASEAIRSLRAEVHFATRDHGMRVLLVTSAEPNRGKSVVAANLAGAIARAGQRVVLVDGDMRQPQQHVLLETTNGDGLSKFLDHPAVSAPSLLLDTAIDRLQLLPAGQAQLSPSELLASPRFTALMTELRQMADVVVIDAPPLAQVSDALLLGAAADAAILVAQQGRTRTGDLRAVLDHLRQVRIAVLGVVLHGAKGARRGRYVTPRVSAPGTAAFTPNERRATPPAYQQRADEHGTRPLNN